MLTHGNLIANCKLITHAFQCHNETSLITWLPLYHDMGLVGGVINPVFIGGQVSMMSPVSFMTRPVRWLNAISKYDGTVSGGPNFAYALCNERISPEECRGLDLSTWELAFNGAEPVRANVIKAFTKKFEPYGFRHNTHYPCYGMAETTLIVTGCVLEREPIIRAFNSQELEQNRVVPCDPDSDRARELVGCGRILPEEKVIIVDPETRHRLDDNQIGEIWIQSPSVGQGYWKKEKETQETFRAQLAGEHADGEFYLRSGDLGFLCDGEVFIAGRIKDLIIVRGVNRYPQDIEATIENSNPRLRTAGSAAFAIEYDGRERLVAVCEVERDRNNKQWGDVIESIRSNVASEHEIPPDAVVLVRAGSVPKTSSGKVQRQACRKMFLEEKLLVVAQWCAWTDQLVDAEDDALAVANEKPLTPAEQEIVARVIEQVKEIACERGKEVDLDTNIVVDLGLDSMERFEIASALERNFGGRFPDDVLQEVETVREVAQAILAHIGSEPVALSSETAEPDKSEDKPIPVAHVDINKMPELIRVQRLKSLLDATGVRNPFFNVHDGRIGDTTIVDGNELISYGSYNYLGLAGHEEVNTAAKAAIDQYGTSVSASRIVSGEKKIHRTLEHELAEFLNVEDVVVFAGGHATNESVIGHLLGPGDLILHDALAHNSILTGAELSGARRRPFDHNDWQQLDQILAQVRRDYRRVMIAIEGLYAMDGDFPDLPRFVEIKKRHQAWLYVDEAHSIGTMGKTGRGIAEHFGIDRNEVEAWMGTLSKAMGSCGGFIAGNRNLVEYLRYSAPGFVFAAGMPPANGGAALSALQILKREPERVQRLQSNAKLFLKLAKSVGLNTGLSANTAIIPVVTGDSMLALQLSETLFDRGIHAPPILHPAVEETQARVRFYVTAEHSEQQIRHTVDTVAETFNQLASGHSPSLANNAAR